MPDFQGSTKFTLRPGAVDVPFLWEFEACSAADANDGSLPYGTLIDSATIVVYDDDGTDVTEETVGVNSSSTVTVSSDGLSVAALVDYPTALALESPTYLKFVLTLTLTTAAVIVFEHRRIIASEAL